MDAEKQSAADSDEPPPFQNKTFDRDVQIRVSESAGAASISPSGRDVVLAK
jgi:WD repeat-containing protein 59